MLSVERRVTAEEKASGGTGDWRAGATGAGGWGSPSDLDLTGPLGEAVATFDHSQC